MVNVNLFSKYYYRTYLSSFLCNASLPTARARSFVATMQLRTSSKKLHFRRTEKASFSRLKKYFQTIYENLITMSNSFKNPERHELQVSQKL